MKILVTGGAGFIGSSIQDKLVTLGHEVAIFDNFKTGKKEYVNVKSKVFEGDILDKEAVFKAFKEFSPEVVFHTAAQISVPYSMEAPFEDQQINIVGTMNVLEAAKENKTRKIIYSNTGGAFYGEVPEDEMPIEENHPIVNPTSFYGVSKGSAETFIKLYGHVYGLEWVSLRYSNVYGPRQDGSKETGIVAIFVKKMMAGEQTTINGNGEHSRDYVYIDDVVDANMKALDYPKNDYFNIAAQYFVSNNEVFDTIESSLKTGMQKEYGPERPGDPFRICLSNQKAKKILGWEPKVDFKEGVIKTIEYYRK